MFARLAHQVGQRLLARIIGDYVRLFLSMVAFSIKVPAAIAPFCAFCTGTSMVLAIKIFAPSQASAITCWHYSTALPKVVAVSVSRIIA